MSVNKKIAEYLRVKGISQSELAEKMNTNQPNLSRILKANDMKVSQLIEMSKNLGVSPSYFFDDSLNVDNEELENLKEENKRLKNYSNLVADHLIILIDSYYNTKIEILKTEFTDLDSQVKELLIRKAENKRDDEKRTYADFDSVFLESVKSQFKIERSEMIKQCGLEIRKAKRSEEETEALKTRAKSIKQAKREKEV